MFEKQKKSCFKGLGNTVLFVIQKKDLPATFRIEDYPDLPTRSQFKVVDKNPYDLFDIKLEKETNSYPKVMIATPKGNIYYLQQGYKIGVGNDLLKLL